MQYDDVTTNPIWRIDTIPVVTDRQTDGHVAVASTRYAYLRRAVKTKASHRQRIV